MRASWRTPLATRIDSYSSSFLGNLGYDVTAGGTLTRATALQLGRGTARNSIRNSAIDTPTKDLIQHSLWKRHLRQTLPQAWHSHALRDRLGAEHYKDATLEDALTRSSSAPFAASTSRRRSSLLLEACPRGSADPPQAKGPRSEQCAEPVSPRSYIPFRQSMFFVVRRSERIIGTQYRNSKMRQLPGS